MATVSFEQTLNRSNHHMMSYCFLMQSCPPPLLLSPSILSTMSSHADVDHDMSPDSGHRELSTDSLSTSANTQSDASWHSALAASATYHQELASRLRDTVLSTRTYPVIPSHSIAGATQSSLCDTSDLVQLGSLPQHLVSPTTDVCGRVLRNSAIRCSSSSSSSGGLHGKRSLSIVDKSISHDGAQLFVNEDSVAEGQDGKSIVEDQGRHSVVDIQHQWLVTSLNY